MWLLFHRKAGTKAVPGGRAFMEECPTCQKRTRFHEVEVSEKYGVWFVDVVGDAERAFRCGQCGDVFDLRDEQPARAQPKPAGVDRVEQLAAEQRRRDAAAAEARTRVEAKIEDELAELKRRLGK
jgi:hypothetical protein